MSDQPQQPTAGLGTDRPDKRLNEPGGQEAGQAAPAHRLAPAHPHLAHGARHLLLLALLVLGGLFVAGYSAGRHPAGQRAATKQSNVYLYADGTQLARDGEVNRENVTLAQISKDAQHAVLAAEDRDFYTESAIDPKAMLRAGWNTATGKGKQSGSTITQQYVKNYYLGQEQTVTRKAKEFFISIKLDREQSPRTTSSRATSTPATSAATPTASRPPPRPTTAWTPTTSTPPRAPISPRCVNAPSEYDVVAHPENQAAGRGPLELRPGRHGQEGLAEPSPSAPAMKFPDAARSQPSPTGLSGQRGYIVAGRQGLPHQQQDHRRGHAATPAATASPPPCEQEQAGRLRRRPSTTR